MLIDNLRDRYPNDGMDITTVWDFINFFAGEDSGQRGALDIVTGYFTIRALAKLHDCIPVDDTFRIISSEIVSLDDENADVIDLLNGDLSVESTLELSDIARKAKEFLERDSVDVRAILSAFCHAKAYIFRNKENKADSVNFYLSGSSNLTDAGLGLKHTSNIELNIGNRTLKSENNFSELSKWYDDVWKNAKDTINEEPSNPKTPLISIKQYFINRIEKLFREYTPEQIYYKILFELFKSDLEYDPSLEHTRDMSLLQTSVIWNTLFNYQQKGVISLIKMLRNYGGAILADAVGLGKTFSALAVIKYFSIQGYQTLLLCPKKLEDNWKQYLRRSGSRFDRDEFDYAVRFHTDLQDDRLERNYSDVKLSWLKRCQKVLIVIDESHNLRNEKSSRYKCLLEEIVKNDDTHPQRDVKVLMLSATPVNTGLRDIKGQFNLIGKGDNKAFDKEAFGVYDLDSLFRKAQKDYNEWCGHADRTIGGLIAMLPPAFFNLTDRLIVARTRSLIEKTLGEDLGFPDKEKPKNIYLGVERFGKYNDTTAVYDAFDNLTLTAYQPSLFLHDTQREARRAAKKDWQDDVNRERFLVKMMSILFMKRLESSWYSCLITVDKVLKVHEDTLQAVVRFKESKSDAAVNADVDTEEDEEFDSYDFTFRKGIKLSEMKNLGGFEVGLRKNVNSLREISKGLHSFKEQFDKGKTQDPKLDELESILKAKAKTKNRKVVIFTAYTDTAIFVYEELLKRGFTRMACVGGSVVRTTGKHPTTKFNKVLESFAPYSKLYKEQDWSDLYEDAKIDRAKFYNEDKRQWDVSYDKWCDLIRMYRPDVQNQIDDAIDILIATDCLSEGQNLQDADMQINYDIHWNPVRLVQRFGRIDRIGSPNKKVQCVNFWPAKTFDEYLNLENRVKNRMAAMDLVGTETQALDEGYKKMVEDNPLIKKNEQRLLRELSENSLSDIESEQTVTLQDFSLETFRQDLYDYIERYKRELEGIPCGVFSGFKVADDLFNKYEECLVAVIGYPCRQQGSTKPYEEIYLMCQPVGAKTQVAEMNRAEVLAFLRTHKGESRFVPEWIEKRDSEGLKRLSAIIDDWMEAKAPQQAMTNVLTMLKGVRPKSSGLVEEKFKKENFDLIVWEYITKEQ